MYSVRQAATPSIDQTIGRVCLCRADLRVLLASSYTRKTFKLIFGFFFFTSASEVVAPLCVVTEAPTSPLTPTSPFTTDRQPIILPKQHLRYYYYYYDQHSVTGSNISVEEDDQQPPEPHSFFIASPVGLWWLLLEELKWG